MSTSMRSQLGFLFLAIAVAGCGPLASCGRAAKPPEPNAVAAAQTAGPTCDACRARMCANAEGSETGVDLVEGCFDKPDPRFVPTPDADFSAHCRAVVECAYKHDCAYDATRGVASCYCGSRMVDECLSQGPASDAPCVQEWTLATRGKSNAEVLERMSLIEYPSGWAFNLLECDRDRCGPRSQVGRCTP